MRGPPRSCYRAVSGPTLEPLMLEILPARSFPSATFTGAEAPRARTTAGCFGTGFIYIQCSTVEISTIQLSYRRFGSRRFGHFDEREAPRLARVSVGDEIHALHAAVGSERCMKIVLRSLITKISDKYVCHDGDSFFVDLSLIDLSLSDCSGTNLSEGKLAAGRHSKGDTDAGKDTLSVSGFSFDGLWKLLINPPAGICGRGAGQRARRTLKMVDGTR